MYNWENNTGYFSCNCIVFVMIIRNMYWKWNNTRSEGGVYGNTVRL